MPAGRREAVTVLRAGRPVMGDPGPVVRHEVRGCVIAPESSDESMQYGNTTATVWTLFAPAGSDIRSSDQVECRGLIWQVLGEPAEWRSPFTQWAPGMKVTLSRVRG